MLNYIAIKVMQNGLKISLSILLLISVLDWPYGYYQFLRFFASLGFSVLAYQAFKDDENYKLILYLSLALLFQPFLKVALGRELWNALDVFIALMLLLSIYRNNLKLKNKKT